jgi:hypothetical protein
MRQLLDLTHLPDSIGGQLVSVFKSVANANNLSVSATNFFCRSSLRNLAISRER